MVKIISGNIRSYRALMLIALMLLLSGCGTMMGSIKETIWWEKIDFQTPYTVQLSARDKATVTSQPTVQLERGGYISIGTLSVHYGNQRCFPAKKGRDCDDKSHNETPTQRLLNEAASKGGDLVVLTSNNRRGSGTATKAGRCLEWGTQQVPRNKCNYETTCGAYGCSTRQTYCTTEYVSQTVCKRHETIYGTEYYIRSSGTVWRKDPEFIVQVRYGEDFYRALRQGDLRTVQTLVAKGLRADIPDLKGRIPLLLAVEGNSAELVKFVLAKNADPRADNSRALSIAVSKRNPEVVRLLLDKGADPNAEVGLFSVMFGNNKKKNRQMESGRPLYTAAVYGDVEIVRLLLDKGADVNADMYQKTILHNVTDDKHVEVMKLLIAKGAGVDKRLFGKSETPLMYAVKRGQVEAVRVLLDAKADVTIEDSPRGLGLLVSLLETRKPKTALAMARSGLQSARTPQKQAVYREIIALLQGAGAKE